MAGPHNSSRCLCSLAEILLLWACLFVPWPTLAARDARTAELDRAQTSELLERAENETGGRALLPQSWAQIQQGLQQERQNPLQYGLWLEVLWRYHMLNDDHLRGREALEEALRFLTAANADPDILATVIGNLSYSLILTGEVAKAKQYLRRGIVTVGQQNRGQLAAFYYSIGDAYRRTGERRVAQRYFQAALEIFQSQADAFKTSATQLKLGNVARESGEFEEAIRQHQGMALEFRRQKSAREIVAQIELARDHIGKRAFDVAERYAKMALDDQRALPEQRMDANILLLQINNERRAAGIAVPRSDLQGAALVRTIAGILRSSAVRQGSKFSRPTLQLQFAEQAIRHYALNRDLANVEVQGRAAVQLVRTIADQLQGTNDDSLAWLAQAQPAISAYVKALYELDRSQVFGLLEAYYIQGAYTGVPQAAGVVNHAFESQAIGLFETYVKAERSLVDAAVELEAAGSNSSVKQRAARQRLEELQRARDLARDAYLANFHARLISKAVRVPEPPSRALPRLPDGDIVIRYFIQHDVSFGVALADREIEYFDLPRRADVLPLVKQSLQVLQKPGTSVAERSILTSLARLLPQEFLLRHADKTRLVIIPDDAVQPLPFAAINVGQPGQPYSPLIERFEIVRTKSATGYYMWPTAARSASRPVWDPASDVVVFADPWPDSWLELPSARVEAASIAAAFRDRAVDLHVGRTAISEVLLSPATRSARVLHIATHGYFSDAAPEIVGLATADAAAGRPGGYLGIADLFASPIASRLVVISACDTMRGKDFNGWGVRSLADGFLMQGAGSVIGTFWRVSDVATAELMGTFYQQLQLSGGNSSQSLRAAQRAMAAKGLADPFFWAGVALESSNHVFDQRAL